MISVRRSAGRSRGDRGSTPSSRLRSRASRMARNFRLIESLWRYGIGGNLARFGCNLTRSVYLMLAGMDWLSSVGHAPVAVMSIVFLFEGARRIALHGVHRGAFLFVGP